MAKARGDRIKLWDIWQQADANEKAALEQEILELIRMKQERVLARQNGEGAPQGGVAA